jgi:type III secretion system HrpB4-like protein
MGASTGFPFARAAAAFAAWERNARTAVQWAHPSWLAGALGVAPAALETFYAALGDHASTEPRADANGQSLRRERRDTIDTASRALLRTLRVPPPAFDTWFRPGPQVLDALPAALGLNVLRMRALLFRRADVRRLIDKRSRLQLAQWVGVPLDRLLAQPPGTAATNAPDTARLVARGALPALDALDADTLAQEGYALMARESENTGAAPTGAIVDAPCPLLRLALPRELPAAPWLDAAAREPDPLGTPQLIARFPELLPEWAWLSG